MSTHQTHQATLQPIKIAHHLRQKLQLNPHLFLTIVTKITAILNKEINNNIIKVILLLKNIKL